MLWACMDAAVEPDAGDLDEEGAGRARPRGAVSPHARSVLVVVADEGHLRDRLRARAERSAPPPSARLADGGSPVVGAGDASGPPVPETLWTRRALFERLAVWGALGRPSVLLDDDTAVWAAACALSRVDPLRARIAHDAEEVRRAFVHGGASADEVARALDPEATGRVDVLRGLAACLADADRRRTQAGTVDHAGALRRALERAQRGEVPGVLRAHSQLILRDVVAPSALELQLLVALARAGLAVSVRVPIDGRGRGISAGVEPVLQLLEAAHDVTLLDVVVEDISARDDDTYRPDGTGPHAPPAAAQTHEQLRAVADALFSTDVITDVAAEVPLEVALAHNEQEEARDIAAVVAGWRQAGGRRIAVALRTLDDGAARVADALMCHGVAVRWPTVALVDTPAGRLVLDALTLARDRAPRDRVLAFLTNTALRGCISSSDGARLLRVLRRAAARTDLEDGDRPTGGYRHRLLRLLETLEDAQERADVEFALQRVERVLALVARIPRSAPLPQLVDGLCGLVEEILDDSYGVSGGAGTLEVRDVLAHAQAACSAVARPDDGAVALPAFVTLVERMLARAHAAHDEARDDDAVELLALPDLFGRSFEHVVVAGMVEGRLPKTERPERLLGDADRIRVNRALGRQVLRLHDDNPLEPGPTSRNRALEPLWMVGALRAAQRSVLLTAPRHDGRGRELAPSMFLVEAERALGGAAAARTRRFVRAPSPRGALWSRVRSHVVQRTLEDSARRGALATAELAPDLLEHAARCAHMSAQRARYFAHRAQGGAVRADSAAPWAFAVQPERITRVFSSSFGLTPERPLTPTRLEALAACRMLGFVEHVLKVNVDPPAGNSADARVLGTLAHDVMERFYLERRGARVPMARMTASDRRRVRALLRERAAPLLSGRATGHLGAIRAQIEWLETALVRAVSMLARDVRVAGVEPSDFELHVGVVRAGGTSVLSGVPLALPLAGGPRSLWIGGVIDRVDEGSHARAVLDYKTATTASIRQKVNAATVFETHFQLLVYLRLLEAHRPTLEGTALHGYLVSLRDGTTSDDVHDVPDLRARILDDARPDGLAAGVARVLQPIFDGVLPPDVGERCGTCRLRRVCRIPSTMPTDASEHDSATSDSAASNTAGSNTAGPNTAGPNTARGTP